MMTSEALRAQTDAICTLPQFNNSFKKQQGCDSKYLLDYPSYYAKNYVVNPLYGIPIKDADGIYTDYLTYRADEANYVPTWGLSKYITIYNIYTSSDDINLSLNVKDKR